MRAMKNKKRGPVQAPFCQLTPQNQNTVEVVFRPPREANIFICKSRVQVGCQRQFLSSLAFIRLKQWELARWKPFGTGSRTPESYKIPQMRLAPPPFFWRRRFRPGRKDFCVSLSRQSFDGLPRQWIR